VPIGSIPSTKIATFVISSHLTTGGKKFGRLYEKRSLYIEFLFVQASANAGRMEDARAVAVFFLRLCGVILRNAVRTVTLPVAE